MKIYALMENISHDECLACEHGLSLYIEADGKKILFDTGASEKFAANAEKMGVDLKAETLLQLATVTTIMVAAWQNLLRLTIMPPFTLATKVSTNITPVLMLT